MRDTDDVPSLQRKARLAAILGTFQASLVDFPYLRDIWRHNTAEVRTAEPAVCIDYVHTWVTHDRYASLSLCQLGGLLTQHDLLPGWGSACG